MKRGIQFLLTPIFIFSGLIFAFSASATIICPTATPLGVGCPSEPSQQYYCNSACRAMDVGYCPTNELAAVAPCSALDACGACSTCQASYLLCTASAYPTRSCTYNDPANHCASLFNSNCNAGECATCTSGYSLCSTNHTCIATQACETWETFNACTNACEGTAPTLKLSFNSTITGVAGTNILQSATPVFAISPSSLVGIGTTTPNARLEVIPATGYSILAGNFKMGNIALPTADADAATKGYVDSVVSSATSSITLWGGATAGNIWNLNSGNVGIGTTTPIYPLDVLGATRINSDTTATLKVNSNGAVGTARTFIQLTRGLSPTENGWDLSSNLSQANDEFSIRSLVNSTATTRFSILSNGNVGIGTSTPGQKLSVYNGRVNIRDINSASYSVLEFGNNTTPLLGGFFAAGSTAAGYGGAGSLNLVNLTSGPLAFGTDNSIDMIIKTGGNVGIGTTTPNARLEVIPATGYSILAGNFKMGNVALPTADADAATKGYVDSVVSSATSSITLWGGATAGNIWNLNSGNVGVGTNSPSQKFEVFGRISQQGLGNNMFIGYNAGLNDNLDVANRNMAIGYYALQANVSGVYNTAIGYWALTASTGSGNLAVGYQALKANTNGGNNTAIGRDALLSNIGGGQNTALGYSALASNTTGSNNMAIGHTALYGNISGGYNTAIGLSAGRYQADGATALTDPENSVYIGSGTRGYDNSDSNSIVIGYNAIGIGANSAVLGNDSITRTALKGNVGIGTTTPGAKLTVVSASPSAPYSGVSILSGASGYYTSLTIGRTAPELYFGIAATTNHWMAGTAAGDSTIIHTGKLHFGSAVGGTVQNTIDTAGNVGIGTTTPLAKLEIIPTSGYSILAGNYKVGNVALPTADADAATKGYVDSVVSSATSSITTLWGGTTAGNIWNLNSGGVGIGTNAPTSQLHIGLNTVGIGTVSVAAGGTAVTGVGTKFLNQVHQGGFTITIGAETRTIATAISDTSMNVSAPFTNAYTDSPYTINGTSKVVIDGNSYARFSYSSILTEINSNNNGAYGLRTNSAVKGNGFYLYNSSGGFYTQGGIPMFYATTAGKFGIGTTSPAGFLHVEGTGNVILNAGNVGIGTASPTNALHVQSTTIPQFRISYDGTRYMEVNHAGFTVNTGTSNNNWATFAMIGGTGGADSRSGGVLFQTQSNDRMLIDKSGNVGIGTTTPLARLEVVPASGYSILAGNYKIGNVAAPTTDSDVATMGWVNSALSSMGALAVYSTSTPATYTGSQSGYSGANVLCAAVVAGAHVCTTGEIFNTINTGAGAAIPSGTTLWVSNGPPGYTANANDCIGWTNAAAGTYGTVWIKLATGDGFGSLNVCNTARSFACCK